MLTTKKKSQNDISNNIKQNIAIETVAKDLGLNLSKQGNDLVGNCPTGHHSHSQTCFHVNPKNNLCYCFNCNKGGSVLDLVMLAKSINFFEALKWFNNQYKLDFKINDYKPLTDEELAEQSRLETIALLYEAIFDEGKKRLFDDEGKDSLSYLTDKRGYDVENIKGMDVIYFPKDNEIKKILKEIYPDASEAINDLKLNGHFGDNFRLAFPYRNINGYITGFVKRSINPLGESIITYDGKQHEGVRFDSTPGLKKDDLFGLNKIKGTETIFIVEGYMDAMYLFELGQKNIVAVGQGLLSQKHLAGLKSKKIKNVIISFDNDEVGPSNTQKAIELILSNSHLNVFVIDPLKYRSCKDPDEFVKKNTFLEFQEIYNTAVDGNEWLINRLANGKNTFTEVEKLDLFEKVRKIAKVTKSRGNKNNLLFYLSEQVNMKDTEVRKLIGNISSSSDFWYFTDKGLMIDYEKYLRFICDLGYAKYYSGKDYQYIKVHNNIVKESSEPIIKDSILDWAANFDEEDQDETHIREYLLSQHQKYLSKSLFECIPPLEIRFKKDTIDTAYFYFKNCIVKINKLGKYEVLDYSSLESPIWETNIIQRDFHPVSGKKKRGDFKQFIWNISGKKKQKYLSLCTAIGYLLHDYKIQSNAKAVVLYDEKIKNTDNPEGRTGKSLIGKAIEQMKNCSRIDGKNFDFRSSFTFQQVKLATKVIDFNDVQKDFDFERLFSVITDAMTIEYKNKTPFEIPFSDSPKILISTNYSIKGVGSSYADRMFEVGISDYYNPSHKPKDDFGHDFFTEWDDEEWILFYEFMIYCIKLYLNKGLIKCEDPMLINRKIINATSVEFFEFAESSFSLDVKYGKKSMYNLFKTEIGYGNDMWDKCPVKQNTFTKYIKDYAEYKGYKYNPSRSNGSDYFTLSDK